MSQTFYWRGYASAQKNGGLISLVNTSTNRSCKISVERFDMSEWAPGMNPASGNASFALKQITGYSNDGIAVTPVQTSGVVALPSQVKCFIQGGVTASANTISRQTPTQDSANDYGFLQSPVTGLPKLSAWMNGNLGPTSALGGSKMGFFGYGSADVSGFVLREGEGFAILPSSDTTLPRRVGFWLQATFRDVTNGRTYSVCCDLTSSGAAGRASFGLYNGAGSGVVLSLLSLDLNRPYNKPNGGQGPRNPPRVKFVKSRGNEQNGESVTMVSADPRYSHPAGIDLQRGHVGAGKILKIVHDVNGSYIAATSLQSPSTGLDWPAGGYGPGIGVLPAQWNRSFSSVRIVSPCHRNRAGLATTGFMAQECFSWNQHGHGARPNDNVQPFVLSPGQGFAAILDSFCNDRTFGSQTFVFDDDHPAVTYEFDLVLSYDSGIPTRAAAVS